KGREELREGELQGALRGHRTGAGAEGESLMPIYHKLGEVPRKRHIAFRKPGGGIYSEQLMGHEGFSGTSSLLYHVHPPTTVQSVRRMHDIAYEAEEEIPLQHRHWRTAQAPKGGSATLD